jgi:hypothetical protein
MDISKITMDLMLAEFNRAVPGLGSEVRFFVLHAEVPAADLVPGLPHSVFPKKIKRPSETHALVADAVQPPRVDGPLINILCQPGNTFVPEEINLLQLFKACILPPK